MGGTYGIDCRYVQIKSLQVHHRCHAVVRHCREASWTSDLVLFWLVMVRVAMLAAQYISGLYRGLDLSVVIVSPRSVSSLDCLSASR